MKIEKLQRNKYYHIGDSTNYFENKRLGLEPGQGVVLTSVGGTSRHVRAKWTGEKRCPKAGEWYLSGGQIMAYRAPNDLSTEFHIAKLVRVKTETVEVITEIEV